MTPKDPIEQFDDFSQPKPKEKKDEGLINGYDCPHCGIWFRLEDAKPSKDKKGVKCPNCDWHINEE